MFCKNSPFALEASSRNGSNRKPLYMQLAMAQPIFFDFSIHTASTVGQKDEIQLERNLLEDHNEDTKDQHEIEIKPFAGNLAS